MGGEREGGGGSVEAREPSATCNYAGLAAVYLADSVVAGRFGAGRRDRTDAPLRNQAKEEGRKLQTSCNRLATCLQLPCNYREGLAVN